MVNLTSACFYFYIQWNLWKSSLANSSFCITGQFFEVPNKAAVVYIQIKLLKSSSSNSSFWITRHRFCFPLKDSFVYSVNHQPILTDVFHR